MRFHSLALTDGFRSVLLYLNLNMFDFRALLKSMHVMLLDEESFWEPATRSVSYHLAKDDPTIRNVIFSLLYLVLFDCEDSDKKSCNQHDTENCPMSSPYASCNIVYSVYAAIVHLLPHPDRLLTRIPFDNWMDCALDAVRFADSLMV